LASSSRVAVVALEQLLDAADLALLLLLEDLVHLGGELLDPLRDEPIVLVRARVRQVVVLAVDDARRGLAVVRVGDDVEPPHPRFQRLVEDRTAILDLEVIEGSRARGVVLVEPHDSAKVSRQERSVARSVIVVDRRHSPPNTSTRAA
jgi:hypothetical protein